MTPRRRYAKPGPEPTRPARDLAELQQRPELGPPLGWIWAVCLCGTTLLRPPEWRGRIETRGRRWGRPVRPSRTLGQPCGDCGAPYKRATGPKTIYEIQPILPPRLALAPRPWPLFRTMWEEYAATAAAHRRARGVA
jgi:hypothetical protein